MLETTELSKLSLHEVSAMSRARLILHCSRDGDVNGNSDLRVSSFILDAAIGRDGVNDCWVKI
jgi:hypothetical protein